MASRLWVVARIAYLALAYTLVQGGLAEAAGALAQASPAVAGRLQDLAPLAGLVVGATPRLLPLALIAGAAWAALAAAPTPAALGLAASAAAVYSGRGPGGQRLGSLRATLRGTLAALAIYLAPAAAAAMGGYLAWRLATATPPSLPGEEATVLNLMNKTIVYRLIVMALATGVAFKAIYHALSLVEAAMARGESSRALLGLEASRESEALLAFRGRQYPVLDSAVSWMTAFLVAPYIYPLLQGLIEDYASGLPAVYLVLASTLAGLVVGWLVLRLILSPLIHHATLEAVLNPRLGVVVFSGILGAAGILAIVSILGGDPLGVAWQAVTGEPGPGDPLSVVASQEPGEEYYRGLAELLDLIVRLFWGG